MKFKRWLALLMAFAVIAGACGGSSDSGETTTGGEGDGGSTETTAGETAQVTVRDITDEEASAAGETVVGDPPEERGPEPSGVLDYAWHTAFSPLWFDPSKNTTSVSQWATQYILHDQLVKSMPNALFTASLAESYTIAEDFTSASFTLRPDLTFHDGSPLTTEDVKFTYENYTGTGASTFEEFTESIEVVDDLNITFNFNKPFLDFLLLYGSTATGAGVILPSDYYTEVGEEGFLEAPIGAGPFKFVENQDNVKIVYEANTDYWKKNPGVQTLNFNAVVDGATRLAALSTGELDLVNVLGADLLQAAADDPNVEIVPTTSVPFWFEFLGMEDPESPFNDIRVREAVQLALNRDVLNQDETGGGGETVGQWIPRQQQGALQLTEVEEDLEKAKALMAEAGYADGFDVPEVIPLPNYFSLGERVIQQLAEINITSKLTQMDRGEFLAQVNTGKNYNFTPGSILVNVSGAGGDAAVRIREFALCDGPASRICDEKIDADFAKYEASTDPAEREQLLNDLQQYIIDQFYFPYVYTLGLNMAQGPDVVEPGNEVWAQIPQYVYPGPWEDIHVSN